MPPATGFWGIDIGQCALKAVRVELVDGKPTATAFDYVEHPKILSQPDADPDMLIREALEKFLSRNEIGRDEVAVGIPGQSGLARFVKLPPVEEKKIAEIVKFEAKQQIPFPLDEVVWDFQKIAGGEVVDGFAMETEVGLFALKRDVISRYMGYFSGSKIEVHTIQMSPLALVNYTTYDLLRKGGKVPAPPLDEAPEEDTPRGKVRCVVVLDIGTEASNLIITDGGKIIWQRPIPLGGNNFTRALTKELKLTFAKAEHLKRNAAKSPELPAILKALKPVLQDFVGEVQRSLGYFTNTHRNALVGYMVGLGSAFRLPGLQKYLAEKLSLEVKKPTDFTRLEGDTVVKDPLFVENILSFPVAYGLALQGAGEARLTTNLLPTEIRTERLIRAKKPYGVAAAAALLLGTAGLALGYGATYKAISDPKVDQALGTAKNAVATVATQESKYNTANSGVADSKVLVKAVVSGQDERLNWPRLQEVLSAALPRPGADGNLPPQLWQSTEGKGAAAYDQFRRRMSNGVPIEEALQYETSEHPRHLAIVNIEAVYPRWVDNLPAFFTKIDDEVYGDQTVKPARGFGEDIARVMLKEEKKVDEATKREKPDVKEGGGWVVEIRGWTDYGPGTPGAEPFIRDGLIANLQKMSTTWAERNGGDKKAGKYIPGLEADPVKGKVSHAFIYHVWPVENPSPNVMVFVNRSYLDAHAGGLSGGAAGAPGNPSSSSGPPPGMVGPSGPGSSSSSVSAEAASAPPAGPPWSPVGPGGQASAQSAGPGSSSGGPRGGAPESGTLAPPTASVGSSSSSVSSGVTLPPLPALIEGTTRKRFEFVVMFVWREPVPVMTPADALTAPAASAGR
ncbi:MAG: type IV pilus assembly protein PilM [Gemmataceae bacterium]